MNNHLYNVIHTYTRAQALEDGVLIEVTPEAKKAGFKIPVAVTHAVWDEYIEWTKWDNENQTTQNQAGRLWDVLWMLYLSCRRFGDESYLKKYSLSIVPPHFS